MKKENEKQSKPRNFRHCGVPCCGNCRWLHTIFLDTYCEHPKNYWGSAEGPFVQHPTVDMVCDWWEEDKGEQTMILDKFETLVKQMREMQTHYRITHDSRVQIEMTKLEMQVDAVIRMKERQNIEKQENGNA